MDGSKQPTRVAPVASYEVLGDFTLGAQLGFGELALEHPVRVAPGRWRALFLDSEVLDSLVDDGQVAEDDARNQLLLIHTEHPAFEGAFPALRFVRRSSIEGARFTAADMEMAPLLKTDDGFYDYLDGTHGVLDGGRGVHVMLLGDGAAEIWLEDVAEPRYVVIDLV